MPIKTIKCSRLNKAFRREYITHVTTPDLEVFVNFDDYTAYKTWSPLNIMCDEYNTKEDHCNLNQEPCTFTEWKSLSK